MSALPTSQSNNDELPTHAGFWIETLSDGQRVLIRPVRSEDRGREGRLVERLPGNTRVLRFTGAMTARTLHVMDRTLIIDRRQSTAFVAIAYYDGELRLIGVAHYCVSRDKEQCECSVTVGEDWVYRCVPAMLMRVLIEEARKTGFTHLFSRVALSDWVMCDLAASLDFHRQPDPDDVGRVIHVLDLQRAAGLVDRGQCHRPPSGA